MALVDPKTCKGDNEMYLLAPDGRTYGVPFKWVVHPFLFFDFSHFLM